MDGQAQVSPASAGSHASGIVPVSADVPPSAIVPAASADVSPSTIVPAASADVPAASTVVSSASTDVPAASTVVSSASADVPAASAVVPAASAPENSDRGRHAFLGEGLAVISLVVATALQFVAKPTDALFSRSAQIEKCVCTGIEESLSCDCIPTPFIIFGGIVAAVFTTGLLLIFRMIRGTPYCRWLSFLLLLFACLFGWSAYTTTPWPFRPLVIWTDVGVCATVSLFMTFCCYWRAIWTWLLSSVIRGPPTSTPTHPV